MATSTGSGGASPSECSNMASDIISIDQIKLEPLDPISPMSTLAPITTVITSPTSSFTSILRPLPLSTGTSLSKSPASSSMVLTPVTSSQMRPSSGTGTDGNQQVFFVQPFNNNSSTPAAATSNPLSIRKGVVEQGKGGRLFFYNSKYDMAVQRMTRQTANETKQLTTVIKSLKKDGSPASSFIKIPVSMASTVAGGGPVSLIKQPPSKPTAIVNSVKKNPPVYTIVTNAGGTGTVVAAPTSTVTPVVASTPPVSSSVSAGLISAQPPTPQNSRDVHNQQRTVCGLVFNSRSVKPDGTVLNVRDNLCNFCQFKSSNFDAFNAHLSIHVFSCNYCSFKSFTRFDVIQHKKDAHPQAALELQGYEGFGVDDNFVAVSSPGDLTCTTQTPPTTVSVSKSRKNKSGSSMATTTTVASPVAMTSLLSRSPVAAVGQTPKPLVIQPESPPPSPPPIVAPAPVVAKAPTSGSDSFFTYKIIHDSSARPQVYECDICQYRSRDIQSMYKHASTHTLADLTRKSGSGTMWECFYCSHRAVQQSDVVKHLTEDHPGKPIQLKRYSNTTIVKPAALNAEKTATATEEGEKAEGKEKEGKRDDKEKPEETGKKKGKDPDGEIKADVHSLWGCYYCPYEDKDHFTTVRHVKANHPDSKLVITRRRLGGSKKDGKNRKSKDGATHKSVSTGKKDGDRDEEKAEDKVDSVESEERGEEEEGSEAGDSEVSAKERLLEGDGQDFLRKLLNQDIEVGTREFTHSGLSKYDRLIELMKQTSAVEMAEIESVMQGIKDKHQGKSAQPAADREDLASLSRILETVDSGGSLLKDLGQQRHGQTSSKKRKRTLTNVVAMLKSGLEEEPPRLEIEKHRKSPAAASPAAKETEEMPSLELQVPTVDGEEVTVATADIVCLTSIPAEFQVDHSQHYTYNRSSQTARCQLCTCVTIGKHALSHMREHVTSHTGEKVWGCPYCQFKCNRRIVIFRHVKRVHPSLPVKLIRRKPYSKNTPSKSTVCAGVRYVETRETVETPVGRMAAATGGQRAGMRLYGPRSVREGDFLRRAGKVWRCPFCGRNSVFRGDLRIHVKVAHPDCDLSADLHCFRRTRDPDTPNRAVSIKLFRVEDAAVFPAYQEIIDDLGRGLQHELDVDDYSVRIQKAKRSKRFTTLPMDVVEEKVQPLRVRRAGDGLDDSYEVLPGSAKIDHPDLWHNVTEKVIRRNSKQSGQKRRRRRAEEKPLPETALVGEEVSGVELTCVHCVSGSFLDPIAAKDHLTESHPQLDPVMMDVKARWMRKASRLYLCPLLGCSYAIYHHVAFLQHLTSHAEVGFNFPMVNRAHNLLNSSAKDKRPRSPSPTLIEKSSTKSDTPYMEDLYDDDDVDWEEVEQRKRRQRRLAKRKRMRERQKASRMSQAPVFVGTLSPISKPPGSVASGSLDGASRESTPQRYISLVKPRLSLPPPLPAETEQDSQDEELMHACPEELYNFDGKLRQEGTRIKHVEFPNRFRCPRGDCRACFDTLPEIKQHLLVEEAAQINTCIDLHMREIRKRQAIYFCMSVGCPFFCKLPFEIERHVCRKATNWLPAVTIKSEQDLRDEEEDEMPVLSEVEEDARVKQEEEQSLPTGIREKWRREDNKRRRIEDSLTSDTSDSGGEKSGDEDSSQMDGASEGQDGGLDDDSQASEEKEMPHVVELGEEPVDSIDEADDEEDLEDDGAEVLDESLDDRSSVGGTDQMYQCSYCSFLSTTEASIVKHVVDEHECTDGGYTVMGATFQDGRVVMNVNGQGRDSNSDTEVSFHERHLGGMSRDESDMEC